MSCRASVALRGLTRRLASSRVWSRTGTPTGGGGGGGVVVVAARGASFAGRRRASRPGGGGRPATRAFRVAVASRGSPDDASAAARDERVTSSENATVKHFAKLVKDRAHRERSGSVVVAGAGLLEEICGASAASTASRVKAKTLILADDAEAPRGVVAGRVLRAPERVLKKAAGLRSADRVEAVAELAVPDLSRGLSHALTVHPASHSRPRRVLALDGIQDPGNLGTLVRTALALGWDAAALLPGTCDPFNDKALRAARGAVFRLPMARVTWDELEAATDERGIARFCAEPTAPDAADATDARIFRGGGEGGGGEEGGGGVCLALGAEGRGLSRDALERCRPVAIPMPGEMESLNVGIAGGILMYLMRP
jgi:TrmH family RNA methyltransferase